MALSSVCQIFQQTQKSVFLWVFSPETQAVDNKPKVGPHEGRG